MEENDFDVSSSLSEAKSNEFPLTSRFCRPEVQKRPMAKPTSDGLGRGTERKYTGAGLKILMLDENFTKECIRSIAVCKCPLNDSQLIQLLDNHQFVVLETDNWWYSIENSRFIYMERSKDIDDVQCYINKIRRRTPIKKISFDSCQQLKTLGDLIHFLQKNQELNKKYDPLFSNCQAFAKRIFDKFAATKKHEIMFGCSTTLEVIPPW